MKTERAYQYRFYPTPEQATLLARTFGCVRFVWNAVLRYRSDAFFQRQEKTGYHDVSAFLMQLKKQPDTAFLTEVSSVPLQQCLRHQQSAFKNSLSSRHTIPTLNPINTDSPRPWPVRRFRTAMARSTLAKYREPLNIRWSRALPSSPSTVIVTKDAAGRYFIGCLCKVDAESLPITPKMVGVDLGLKDLFMTSDGKRVNNPRHTAPASWRGRSGN